MNVMGHSIPQHARICQATAVDQDHIERSTAVDLEKERWLGMLRQAIEDAGWKHEALTTYLQIDKAYLSRLLTGEKPFRPEHLVSLPPDVKARFAHLQAESFGLIVVKPLEGQDAVRALVAGLVGVMKGASLPARADRMAKATEPVKKARTA